MLFLRRSKIARLIFLITSLAFCLPHAILAGEPPMSLRKYEPPTQITMEESPTEQFSMEKAVRSLDSASLHWQATQRCVACHTNFLYLYARSMVSADDPAPRDIRKALEEHIAGSFKEGHGLGEEGAVQAVTALAMSDAMTGKRLHPLTKQALDHLWTLQKEDGSLPWDEAPPTGTTHFGIMMVSIAVGVAPEGYAQTDAAQKGLARIRAWMAKHPPQNVHDEALLLWASTYHDGYLTLQAKRNIVANLRANQLADGGWALAGIYNWNRKGRKIRDHGLADGYATGLCIYAMRKSGVPADDPAVKKGIAWLKANQRESGRWFTRSLHHDGPYYISNIGTAFAVMALQSCPDSAQVQMSGTRKR